MPAPTSHVRVPSLRHWRIKQYLTQRTLADRAGVSITTVARGEQDYLIALLSARKLADVLGVTVAQLKAGEPQE